jgi:hypothetical protein
MLAKNSIRTPVIIIEVMPAKENITPLKKGSPGRCSK